MTESMDILETITSTYHAVLGYTDLQPDEDVFDRGASSLTIVELQIQVESKLKLEVPTSELMAAPSIKGWYDAYSAVAAAVAKP